MDSALSRTMRISFERRIGHREVRSLGFSTPAPMTSESLARKRACETGNPSQRMNRRCSPNRASMRWWWRMVRAIDVFPMPPAPMSAMGSRFSASLTTFSISSSRPKQALGHGGGDSPREMLRRCKIVDYTAFNIADLV